MSELPVMRTFDVVELYQWAAEFASRPDCASPLGKLVGRELRGGKWRREDWQDLAYSVLAAVANVEPALHRETFRHFASIESHRAASLKSELADLLADCEYAEGKKRSQLLRLSEAALFVMKTQYQWPKPAGLTWYARFLGIKRQSLDSANWRKLIREAETILDNWMASGCNLAESVLREKGLIRT